MTTSPGYQSEQWTPLDQTGRTWETKLSASTPRTATATATRPVQDRPRSKGANDDLAIEAGYSRPGRLTSPAPDHAPAHATVAVDHTAERVIDHPTQGASRYKPPVIKEQHVWGVADEWGKKAGKWGEGSKAFDRSRSRSGTGEGEGEEDGGKER